MTKTKVEKIMAGELIFDMDLYPRQKINAYSVSRLVEALKSGAKFPPVHADRRTKVLSDGFHRTEAYIRFGGAETLVPVTFHDYKNKREMFVDSLLYNGNHGTPFSVFDIGRILVKSAEMGEKLDKVCRLLNITEYKADKILNRVRPVKVRGKKPTRRVVIKERAVPKLIEAETISPAQAEVNEHALGSAPLRLAKDLLDKIEADCLIYTVDLLFVFERLRDALSVVIESNRDEAAG